MDLDTVKLCPRLGVIPNISCNFVCSMVSVESISSSLILLGGPEAPSIWNKIVSRVGVGVGENMVSISLYGEERNSFFWGDARQHQGYGLEAENRLDLFQVSFRSPSA